MRVGAMLDECVDARRHKRFIQPCFVSILPFPDGASKCNKRYMEFQVQMWSGRYPTPRKKVNRYGQDLTVTPSSAEHTLSNFDTNKVLSGVGKTSKRLVTTREANQAHVKCSD